MKTKVERLRKALGLPTSCSNEEVLRLSRGTYAEAVIDLEVASDRLRLQMSFVFKNDVERIKSAVKRFIL